MVIQECAKKSEDDEIVICLYSGGNWNDGVKSRSGDNLLDYWWGKMGLFNNIKI